MGKNSFISNFKDLPWGVLFAMLLFMAAEVSTRYLWQRPDIIGEDMYKLTPTYDYCFTSTGRTIFEQNDNLVFFKNPCFSNNEIILSKIKPLNEYRIFLYGTSPALSSSRGPHFTPYINKLEDLLKAHYPQTSWKIINFSHSGWGSIRILNALRRTINYHPDLIIIQPHGSNEEPDKKVTQYRTALHRGFTQLLIQSQFIVIFQKLARQWQVTQEIPKTAEFPHLSAKMPRSKKDQWATFQKNINQMLTLANNESIPVIIIGRMVRNRDGPGFEAEGTRSLNAQTKRNTEQHHAFYLDAAHLLYQAYPKESDKETLFPFDAGHYSEAGHVIIAQGLFDLLTKEVLPKEIVNP